MTYSTVNVHSYIIYPEEEGGEPLPLGNSDEDKDKRHRSSFAIAIVEFNTKPVEILTSTGAIGYILVKLFEDKNLTLKDPEHILTYDSLGRVSVRNTDNPTEPVIKFHQPRVAIPGQSGRPARAPSAPDTAGPSRTGKSPEGSGSTGGSAGASSSRPDKRKPKPDSGKNETNPSNAQASNSAAREKGARLIQCAIGNA